MRAKGLTSKPAKLQIKQHWKNKDIQVSSPGYQSLSRNRTRHGRDRGRYDKLGRHPQTRQNKTAPLGGQTWACRQTERRSRRRSSVAGDAHISSVCPLMHRECSIDLIISNVASIGNVHLTKRIAGVADDDTLHNLATNQCVIESRF